MICKVFLRLGSLSKFPNCAFSRILLCLDCGYHATKVLEILILSSWYTQEKIASQKDPISGNNTVEEKRKQKICEF
jgi:hypothetical protein